MKASDNRAVVLEFPHVTRDSVPSPESAARGHGIWWLLSAIDTLDHCLVFTDRYGRIQHASRAFRDQITDGALCGRIEEFARKSAGLAAVSRLGSTISVVDVDTATTANGEYRLRSTYVGFELFGHGPCVLIAVTPPPPDPLNVDRLRECLLLTRAQARVAQLLARGLRNDEIAARLFLSAHTVRHHVERIRWKVGGHTRAAVAARLRGDVVT